MNIYIFGNGNISFSDFKTYYHTILLPFIKEAHFSIGDFRGTDTLAMEVLKSETAHVAIYHVGEQPRYLPDKYKTKVSQWQVIGGFADDEARDLAAIHACTHYLAIDFNTNAKRTSGTFKNIALCESLGKIALQSQI
jgi:hypothetical protein